MRSASPWGKETLRRATGGRWTFFWGAGDWPTSGINGACALSLFSFSNWSAFTGSLLFREEFQNLFGELLCLE